MNRFNSNTVTSIATTAISLVLGICCMCSVHAQPPSRETTVRQVQQRVAKVYGAGGLAGLEAYQSGCIVSPEGHIATVWSYVLDVDPIVVLDDGRRFEAKIVGFEPKLELAVLKIDAVDLPFFRMTDDVLVQPGSPVLAVSNLFSIASGNEPASVMRGYIASESKLEARRGTFRTAYSGTIYVLDLVANNPGAAGGALVDVRGQLLGMLGKELRDDRTGVWLNYALPTKALRAATGDIVAGRVTSSEETEPALPQERAMTIAKLGIVLVPDVLEKTPAFVDAVLPGSPAAASGILVDDLVLLVAGRRVENQMSLQDILRTIDVRDPVSITLQRGTEIVTATLRAE